MGGQFTTYQVTVPLLLFHISYSSSGPHSHLQEQEEEDNTARWQVKVCVLCEIRELFAHVCAIHWVGTARRELGIDSRLDTCTRLVYISHVLCGVCWWQCQQLRGRRSSGVWAAGRMRAAMVVEFVLRVFSCGAIDRLSARH